MRLTDDLNDVLIYRGQRLYLNLAFDVVLRAQELQQDTLFSDGEKIDLLCEMFVHNYEDIARADLNAKAEIITTIYDKFVNDGGSDPGEKPTEPIFDFEQDASIIYSSFLYNYGIDLFDVQGQLHWKKFLALLSSLSEDSKFGKVVGIRTAKLPKRTKENAEERAHLLRMKRLYALKPTEEIKETKVKRIDNELGSFLGLFKKKKGGRPNVGR